MVACILCSSLCVPGQNARLSTLLRLGSRNSCRGVATASAATTLDWTPPHCSRTVCALSSDREMADPTDPLPDVLSAGDHAPASGAQAELLAGTEGLPFS